MNLIKFSLIALILFVTHTCEYSSSQKPEIKPGAERTEVYIPKIKGKKVAVVVNHTSLICNTPVVDSLLSLGVNIKKIFSPEHGYKGKAEAGEIYSDSILLVHNIEIISLYGNKIKPVNEDLAGIDILVFDIQDVGARFYTYISTLHYIMEACAENNIPLLILDRPNPNGHYVDGPVLDLEFKSFVGMHPVPVVHGMTIGEYAEMINGEKWLSDSAGCQLEIVTCENYKHSDYYMLPVNPSPNIRNMKAVYLYPSLCFFEGTIMNEGRGTDFPFQVYGHPDFPDRDFYYIPESNPGALNPRHKNLKCYGVNLRDRKIEELQSERKISLSYLIYAYSKMRKGEEFFSSYFNTLAGNNNLKSQIIRGLTEEQIRSSWQKDLLHFKTIRKKYLLYSDFE
ncbi:MAG: DUF1343 domain-containing protein [Bacteroidales bacterium]|nr:MAG: DUF1343 domain-containing protein [Bacteroidales bacterium]